MKTVRVRIAVAVEAPKPNDKVAVICSTIEDEVIRAANGRFSRPWKLSHVEADVTVPEAETISGEVQSDGA